MNIPEAIEILTVLESRSINNSRMAKKDALALGIEALKRVESHRLHGKPDRYSILPGETE